MYTVACPKPLEPQEPVASLSPAIYMSGESPFSIIFPISLKPCRSRSHVTGSPRVTLKRVCLRG
jgi:hypothetical protein